ncbi:MAG: ABC transporter permease [Firmicutes bacterium]|nr:ABC transporter permease [Lachnospiraceae bacterium]MDD6066266.1 ABC transporter permease [Bacillota bacterium]MDY2819790.1 ABC transporter permease [Hominisplanchenecus sp.]
MKKKLKVILQGFLSFAVLLIIWNIASNTGIFGRVDVDRGRLLLPPPVEVAKELWEILKSGYLPYNIWVSMKRVLSGFLIAAAIGTPVGILMGMSTTLRNFLHPIFRLFSPIPGVAWVPLAILWFGLGNSAAVFIITMGALSPIITNTLQGVMEVDEKLIQVLRIMEANKWQIIKKCIVPSIIPYLVSGFKLGLGFAWRAVIAAELVGVPEGLGYVLNVGRNTANTAITLITILSLGVIMILMENLFFTPLERYTANWKAKE